MKILTTTLYTQQRLNNLRTLLERLENSISEIEKDTDSIDSDINLLKRNQAFLQSIEVNINLG
jgi:archaellum component FlaC